MDAWTFQGIELHGEEEPLKLAQRISRLEATLGFSVGFKAIGTFRAPMSKSDPPRYSPNGQSRRFLHITWQDDSANAWAILLQVAQRDKRSLLSSFTGVGFLSKDIDFRDGHPKESVILAAFNSDAVDFHEPLVFPTRDNVEERLTDWRCRVAEEATRRQNNGIAADRLAVAVRLSERQQIRFEYGWYLKHGIWRSRYLVRSEDGFMAIAAAQDSLCTCASRHPETLQLMMPSAECIHHLAATLVDAIAEPVLAAP